MYVATQNKMQEYKGQGIVLQGDTNNNNLFKVRVSGRSFSCPFACLHLLEQRIDVLIYLSSGTHLC